MRAALLFAVVASSVGCSLLEKLSEQQFSLTADFMIDTTNGERFPPWPLPADACTQPDDCCPPAAADCTLFSDVLLCDGAACGLSIPLVLLQRIDVRQSVDQFRNATSLVDVRVVSLDLDLRQNTLSFPLPAAQLYVAPIEVTDPSAPEARVVGSLPTIAAAGSGTHEVETTEEGLEALQGFLASSGAPFNLILVTEAEIGVGAQAQGMLVAQLVLEAKARPEIGP